MEFIFRTKRMFYLYHSRYKEEYDDSDVFHEKQDEKNRQTIDGGRRGD